LRQKRCGSVIVNLLTPLERALTWAFLKQFVALRDVIRRRIVSLSLVSGHFSVTTEANIENFQTTNNYVAWCRECLDDRSQK
jgi:hypothetical protein